MRVAIITGGAKGIGRAIALDLAARGWSVALCFRTSEQAALDTAEALRAAGGRALALPCDVSDPAQCEELVSRTTSEWGQLDALVHCAGPYHRVALLEETPEAWRQTFDHNLHSLFYLSRLVAPLMRAQRQGRIVAFGVANLERLSAPPFVAAYYAAKAGLLALSRALAKELAPDGVTVNVVSPGFIDSGGLPPDELQRMLGSIPAGYLGQPSDAVAAVRFLLSDEARYITGAHLPVSGGWGL